MTRLLQSALAALLTRTPLGRFPVRVRGGVAAGARWTLYPWTSYWRGTHEPAMQETLVNLGGGDIRGWSCWDLGAHFGLYSIGLARRVGPAGQVAAFEPNPVSFARLQCHARMNRLPWLRPYPAAVSDHSRGSELLTYGDLAETTTHLPYDGEARTDRIRAITVPTLRLDDLVAAGELRVPQFVKVDVEGHGHHALAGMRAALTSAPPVLAVALHNDWEVEGIRSILAPLGYTWREIGKGPEQTALRPEADYLFTPPRRPA